MIDSYTKRIITLITQSSTKPPAHLSSNAYSTTSDPSTSIQLVLHGSKPNIYTRDEFKRDIEYLVEALFAAATRAPLALTEL